MNLPVLTESLANSLNATENTDTVSMHTVSFVKKTTTCSVFCNWGLAYISTLGNEGTGIVCTQVSTDYVQQS